MTNIIFTDAACTYIMKMLQKEQGVAFRLSVKKTGCSGFSYVPEIVQNIPATDIVVPVKEITVLIDPLWAHILTGLQVDYVAEDKTGLKQKRLVFNNPNEATRCGCGESFHLSENN